MYASLTATMTLDPHQRWFLVSSLVPLVNLMWPNSAMLVGDSQLLIPLAMVAMQANNKTPPYPEQGGVLFAGNFRGRMYLEI